MVALANGLNFGTAGSLRSVVGLRPRDIEKPTRVNIKLRRVLVANILHQHFPVYGTIAPMGIYVEPHFQFFEGYEEKKKLHKNLGKLQRIMSKSVDLLRV
ncbi:hypothetical protein BGZ52_001145 [Haplosporangium bisporale]|uniref:Uncharacterized protein n=1 Tax=Podila verticillata NRRL 6337 TaxID=1069443 RepID=A0A086TKC9_9FUNG|nr:hypothetical protein BGZ52_001145 [Haplosporangium bisporale]KFH62406.1 hypothetical protein MVEG_11615 [Podila verticillata NRRL 6337]